MKSSQKGYFLPIKKLVLVFRKGLQILWKHMDLLLCPKFKIQELDTSLPEKKIKRRMIGIPILSRDLIFFMLENIRNKFHVFWRILSNLILLLFLYMYKLSLLLYVYIYTFCYRRLGKNLELISQSPKLQDLIITLDFLS